MTRSRKFIAILLGVGACCALPAWKVVPEGKDQPSEIKTIIVSEERMVIVNKNGTSIDVKFADLEKIAGGAIGSKVPTPAAPPPIPPPPAANPAPPAVTLTEAAIRQKIANSGSWFMFTARPMRFKVFGKQQYVPIKEGMAFKGAIVNKRLYLRNLDDVLFEPTWENSFDFSRYVTEFGKYQQSLQQHLAEINNNLAAAAAQREETIRNIYFLVNQIVQLLQNRSYSVNTLVDNNGNVNLSSVNQSDIEASAMTFYLDLQRKLWREERNKREVERHIKEMNADRDSTTEAFRQCVETQKSLAGK